MSIALVVIAILLTAIVVLLLMKKEKYEVDRCPEGLPAGCKDCNVYKKCMKNCYGLYTNCDSMCFEKCTE